MQELIESDLGDSLAHIPVVSRANMKLTAGPSHYVSRTPWIFEFPKERVQIGN